MIVNLATEIHNKIYLFYFVFIKKDEREQQRVVSLPVAIPMAALPPPLDPEDKEQGQDPKQDVPGGQEQVEDNQSGGKQFFNCNFIKSSSLFFILIEKLHLYVL